MTERLPLASVALVSGAVLATEILLTRSFAVVHWHHFAYMIISLALLGFGASGTFLVLARRVAASGISRPVTSATSSPLRLAVIVSPLLAKALPFQAEALLWDPWQPLWLVLIYLTLSTPFFCAANAIGLALIAFRDRAGRVYAADLVGAGAGSVIVLALLYWLWPESCAKVVAACGPRGAAGRDVELRRRQRTRGVDRLAAVLPRRKSCLRDGCSESRAVQGAEPGTADRWHAIVARAVESAGPRQRDRKSARAAAFGARLEPRFHQRTARSDRPIHRWRQPAGDHGGERR